MAYGLRYISTAYGLSSVQWKVELYEKDYTTIVGSLPTELRLLGDGIKIGYDRNDDRFTTIYSRYAILDFKTTVNFDINTLQFDDEKKYQVKIYRNNLVEFTGWLIPFYSSQEFEDIKISKISVQAKDGINQLKNKKYVDERPEITTNRQSQKDIISQCLREIGYNMTLEVYYNKFESSMSKTILDCPLAQTDFNIYSLEKDETTNLDYYEVLDRILTTHDLRIAQAQGVWRIVSQIEVLDGVATGRVYDYLGQFQSAKTLNTDVTFHTGGLKVKSNSIIRKDIPIQQISAFYEVGVFTNILANGKLTQFSGNTPINWNPIGGWAINEVSRILNSNGIQFDNTFTTSEGIGEKYFESAEIDITGLSSFKFTAEAYADSDIDSVKIAIILYSSINSSYKYYVDKYGSIKEKEVTAIIDKGSQDRYVTFDLSFVTNSAIQYLNGVDKIKIRIYPGVKLTSAVPIKKKVKFKNLILTGQANSYDKEFLGRVYEYKNNALTGSKVQDEYEVYYQDNIGASISKFRNTLFIAGTNTVTNSWKRTSETTSRTLLESCLVDRLAVTAKFNDIFEGVLKGYINLINTPFLSANSKRFLVLSSEYSLQEDSTEVVLVELASSNISFTAKIYDRYNGGKTVDVSEGVNSESINGNEDYDKPIKSNGGISHGILYPDGGIDSLPKNTTNPRAGNKGILIFGGTNAEGIELGNKENQTLVDVLGGKIKVGYNLLYDKSITDGDGDIVKQLGVDSDFQVDGRIEAVSGISVGQDGILITKELGKGGKAFGQVDAQNELRFVSPIVNVTNVLGVNQITGINGLGVNVNAPFTFTQPIYVLPSNNPNSPITNAQFNTALSGGFAVSTTCKLLFVTNQTLTGAKTQGDYTTVTGDSILLNGQTTASENGIYVFDGTNWTRNTANDTSAEIRGKGHLILNGTYKSTQWVNNNPADITLDTTAITYTQWSGAELDPIFTSHPAFGVTNAKIASWDLVSSYGTHLGLYVDLVSNQSNIGGAKTFTTSVQSPIFKAGSNSVNIQMFNYFGTPRIASNANTLDFFAVTNFTWTTVGDLSRMKLNTTGLRIGSFSDPLFNLHISGTTGFEGLISVGNTSQGIAMSSGTTGQFLRKSNVSNGFYNVDVNNWANIFVADISDIATFYQAKITATENYLIKKTTYNFGDSQIFDNGTFLAIGGTTSIDSSKFNVIGKIGATTARIGDNTNGINIGNLAISSTGALGYNATSHSWSIATVEKLNLNGTRLALTGNLNVTGDVDITGKFKLNGSFGTDHTFLKSNGTTQEFSIMTVGEIADIDTVYASKTFTATNYASKQDAVLYGTFEGERGFKLFHDATKLDTAALFFANQDTGIVGIHYFGLDNSNNVTQHGVHIDGDGFVYHKKLNGSRARFLTTDDSLSGNGTSYLFAEPIFLNGNQISVRTASATQTGVLTKEDWSKFNTGVLWNGGLVSNNIQLFRPNGDNVELLWGASYPITSVTSSSYGNLAARITWKNTSPGLYTLNFGNGVNGMVIETAYTGDGMYIGTQGEMKLKGGKIFLNGIELNMTKVASQIGV
jgi:hypothetical protein